MTKVPEYVRQGWKPAGPGKCRCPNCAELVSTNALARNQHRYICSDPAKREAAKRERIRGRLRLFKGGT